MKGSTTWPSILGAARYEFRMQARRKALWVVFAAFAPTVFLLSLGPWTRWSEGLPVPHLVANWSLAVQFFLPIAFGCLLADRVPRDGLTHVQELLEALPAALGVRFLGKYIGATLATLVPVLLIWAMGIAYIATDRDNLEALPLGLAAFAVVNLPGLLFVAAFSVSCPVILWVPLYQFLFVGYWFWGNLIPQGFGMPTLSHTILTPFGEYTANGFFGTEQATARATVFEGIASMALLIGLGALALLGGYALLRRQENRR